MKDESFSRIFYILSLRWCVNLAATVNAETETMNSTIENDFLFKYYIVLILG